VPAIAIVAVALAAVVGLVVVLAGDDDEPEATSGSTDAGVEGGTSVFDLEVGDCFDDPQGSGSGPAIVEDVETVDCAQPHDNEVFFLYDLEGDGGYPGLEAVRADGNERCADEFEGYVGAPVDETDLYAEALLYPNATSWDAGDREIVCALYHGQLEELTGSMRNTG
jgi:hypothetical protein